MNVSLILLAFLAIALVLLAVLVTLAWGRNRATAENPVASRIDALTGRFEMIVERLNRLDQNLGDSIQKTATDTAKTFGSIETRLTVIDEAQKNISSLSGQVVSLQEILSNKQTRGLFGQAQMEAIVSDGLPPGIYEFQATLSNGNRPDCLIRLPGSRTAIVIDSKFPLESFSALKADGDGERKAAMAAVRSDMLKHIKGIAEKYILPGETQTPAIMFVPSESIYAELHENFADVIQRAQRAQIVVVSPNILMLAIATVQTVMKDARMRDQANLIQKEVGTLLQDVKRLGERVVNLQRHFNQTEADIKDIVVSTEKIAKRGAAIEAVELGTVDEQNARLTSRE